MRVDGKPVSGITPGVGFMFQNDAVFPWKSVLDNVAAGPRFRGSRPANAAARDWLRRVGLAGFEDRYPHQLSGGMRKRVALAQSLINEPRVLLMDEPFSALDVQTRSIMSDELLGLWEQTRPAVIFVTHDLEEAIALADKVVVLTAGPGRIKATFKIDLPRPRKAQEIRFTDEFVALYSEIWEALRSEVETAYARAPRRRRRDDRGQSEACRPDLTAAAVISAAPVPPTRRRAGPQGWAPDPAAHPAERLPSRVGGPGAQLLGDRRQHQAHRPVLLGPAQPASGGSSRPG